eukprot:373393_1
MSRNCIITVLLVVFLFFVAFMTEKRTKEKVVLLNFQFVWGNPLSKVPVPQIPSLRFKWTPKNDYDFKLFVETFDEAFKKKFGDASRPGTDGNSGVFLNRTHFEIGVTGRNRKWDTYDAEFFQFNPPSKGNLAINIKDPTNGPGDPHVCTEACICDLAQRVGMRGNPTYFNKKVPFIYQQAQWTKPKAIPKPKKTKKTANIDIIKDIGSDNISQQQLAQSTLFDGSVLSKAYKKQQQINTVAHSMMNNFNTNNNSNNSSNNMMLQNPYIIPNSNSNNSQNG